MAKIPIFLRATTSAEQAYFQKVMLYALNLQCSDACLITRRTPQSMTVALTEPGKRQPLTCPDLTTLLEKVGMLSCIDGNVLYLELQQLGTDLRRVVETLQTHEIRPTCIVVVSGNWRVAKGIKENGILGCQIHFAMATTEDITKDPNWPIKRGGPNPFE